MARSAVAVAVDTHGIHFRLIVPMASQKVVGDDGKVGCVKVCDNRVFLAIFVFVFDLAISDKWASHTVKLFANQACDALVDWIIQRGCFRAAGEYDVRIDLHHADKIGVEVNRPQVICRIIQERLSHRGKVGLSVSILLIHIHPHELGVGTVNWEVYGATYGWAGLGLESCERLADGTVNRQIYHLTFLAAVVGTFAVDAGSCLMRAWADKALLPVMVVIMLHRGRYRMIVSSKASKCVCEVGGGG